MAGCETRCGSTRTCSGSGSSRGKPFVPLALESAFCNPCARSFPRSRSRMGSRSRGGAGSLPSRPRSVASRTAPCPPWPSFSIVDHAPDRGVPAVERRGRRGRAPGGSSQPDLPPRPCARATGAAVPAAGAPAGRAAAMRAATVAARHRWHRATSVGLPYAGHLVGGTQLPGHGAGLGHVESGHGQRPEPRVPASTPGTSTRSARSSRSAIRNERGTT